MRKVYRKTVRKWLKGDAPKAPERAARKSRLDPCKDYLKARPEDAGYTAQRLRQDIRAQGYAGSYNLVNR